MFKVKSAKRDKITEIVDELRDQGYKSQEIPAIKITCDDGYYIIVPAKNEQGFDMLFKRIYAKR